MTDRLAAMRARIKAKEAVAKEKVKESIAASNKEWDEQMAKEREEKRIALQKRRDEEAAQQQREEAAKRRKLEDLPAPSCQCGRPALRKAVTEEGPDFGRPFFACALGRREDGACDYYKLAEDLLKELESVTPSGPTLCYCGKEAKSGIVKKEGPNSGRSFFACAGRPEEGGCKFFKWNSEQPPSPEKKETLPKCSCGLEAEIKKVAKEGPNFGRRMFVCVKGRKDYGGCDFFQWAPDAPEGATESSPTQTQNSNLPKCRCGFPTVSKSVTNQGPNSGREFVACAKGKKEYGGCGYFMWASDITATNSNDSSAATATVPLCRCGVPVERRVVEKEGANRGRAYKTCKRGKKEYGGCGYFEWENSQAAKMSPNKLAPAGA